MTIQQNNAVVQLWEQCSEANSRKLHPYDGLIIDVSDTNDQAIALKKWLLEKPANKKSSY